MTDEGLEQCQGLREGLKRRLEGETDIAIVVSPMKRTLQTALTSLDWLIERGTPIVGDANWQGRPAFHIPGSETSSHVEKKKWQSKGL